MRNNNSTRVNPVNITVTLRKQEELKLRLAGMDYREIRDAMLERYGKDALPGSYDERFVWRDIQSEMRRNRAMALELANDVRAMENQRLDQLQLSLFPKALGGDYKAVNAILRIMDHRAKMFGLYAPAQVKVHDWRSEVLELIQSGVITREQVEVELGTELTQQLLESRSSSTVEGRFVEEESTGDQEDSAGREVAG